MRLAAVLLAALLLAHAPPARAAPPVDAFPEPIRALAQEWVREAEALGAPYADRAWYAEAEGFLGSAREAASAGRVRSVMFDVETYVELVVAGALVDEAKALPSEAEGKALVLQRTGTWHAEALAEWRGYRERLLEAQPQIRSVRGLEIAMYSADQALGGRLMTEDRENLAREFPRQAGVDRAYVMGLVRAGYTARLALEWAGDILGVVGQYEGLPPRLNETAWDEIQVLALQPLVGQVPTHLEPFERVGREVRERNETILALMVNLAEQRASRATSIFVIYGDATSRGKNVTADATAAMSKQVENMTMELPRSYGLLGVFTADAADRGAKTRDVAAKHPLDLGVIIAAWAALDHQLYATNALAAVSTQQPAEENGKDAPLGALWPLAALALAAAALRAARRRA